MKNKNKKFQFRENEQLLIQDLIRNGRQDRSWYDLAQQYNITPLSSRRDVIAIGRAANDVWRRHLKFNKGNIGLITQLSGVRINSNTTPMWQMPHYIDAEAALRDSLRKASKSFPPVTTQTISPKTPKRLFYDIETSYNVVKSWRVGYNLSIQPEDILQERAIITIAYKWQGDEEVTVLTWDKGCDKKIIEEFSKVMSEADELVGHNVDKFDTKFILARALKHGISVLPKYQSTDTLKLARKHFMLNSNKLDYIAQYLGIGSKTKHRGMAMWDDIILRHDNKALEEMVEYNVQDVFLTEEVYHKLVNYSLPKVNHTTKQGGDKHCCPECGSDKASLLKTYVSAAGSKTRLMSCSNSNCETSFTISDTNYNKHYGK